MGNNSIENLQIVFKSSSCLKPYAKYKDSSLSDSSGCAQACSYTKSGKGK